MPDNKLNIEAANTAALSTNTNALDANTEALKSSQPLHAKPEIKVEQVKTEQIKVEPESKPEVKTVPEPELTRREREQERKLEYKLAVEKVLEAENVNNPVHRKKAASPIISSNQHGPFFVTPGTQGTPVSNPVEVDVQTTPSFSPGNGVIKGPAVSPGGTNNFGPWFIERTM